MRIARYIKHMVKIQTGLLLAAAGLMILPVVTFADPPPWAPAWGYRAKHDNGHGKKHKYKHKDRDEHEYEHEDEDEDEHVQYRTYYQEAPEYYAQVNNDIQAGTCNRDLIGGVVGGIAGGLVGSQFGKGDGKLATTAAGAILGFVIGKNVGQRMDEVDVRCTGYALEAASDQQKVVWENPDNGGRYAVTPTRTFTSGDRYCREYTTRATIGGRSEDVYGTACRNPDGSWQIVQ